MRRVLEHTNLFHFHFQTFLSLYLCMRTSFSWVPARSWQPHQQCLPPCMPSVFFRDCPHTPPRADITATYELLHICLWIRSAPDAACNGTLPPSWKPKWNFPLPVSLLPPSSPPNHLCPALGGACRGLSRQDINGPVLQSEGLTQPCFTVASPWRTRKKFQSLLGERCCFFF